MEPTLLKVMSALMASCPMLLLLEGAQFRSRTLAGKPEQTCNDCLLSKSRAVLSTKLHVANVPHTLRLDLSDVLRLRANNLSTTLTHHQGRM